MVGSASTEIPLAAVSAAIAFPRSFSFSFFPLDVVVVTGHSSDTMKVATLVAKVVVAEAAVLVGSRFVPVLMYLVA